MGQKSTSLPRVTRAVLAVGILAASLVVLSTAPSSAAPGSISGTVFRDWNQNGVQSGASGLQLAEPGVAGIQVQAFDAQGTGTAVATTGTDGRYTLSLAPLSNAVSSTYRVQFTIPAALDHLEPGPVPAAATTGTIRNGTSVQFSAANTAGPGQAGVDFGVANPTDFCQTNPNLACPILRGNSPTGSGTITTAAYTASGATPTLDTEAQQNQTGSVWGLAYDRSESLIYSAAFAKRHAPYLTNTAAGPDRIFVTDVGGANDAAVLLTVEAGNTTHTADLLDDTSFAPAVGKEGFGDIDIDEDDRHLWVVNLNTRQLLRVDPGAAPAAGTGSVVNTYAMPNPGTGATGCPNHGGTPAGQLNLNLRPGGLDVKDGTVYVTLTCTAEQIGTTAPNNTVTTNPLSPSADALNRRQFLRGFVYAFNPDTATFSQVANFPLNYDRGCISRDTTGACPDADDVPAEFNPWTPALVQWGPTGTQFGHVAYPQPWLSGVEVDDAGGMSVAVMDRFGHLAGNDKGGANTAVAEGAAGGDVLRLTSAGATFSLESNGTAGTAGSGVGNAQGPGGGEFYGQDNFGGTHDEVTVGGIANRPGGRSEILAGVYDPVTAVRAGGLHWYSNTNGALSNSAQFFVTDDPQTFGKVAGIGDIELLCDQAPVQIGNRVWLDADGDGIQDPGEAPIPGMTVQLRNAANTATIATTTTDANGQYLFTNIARDTAFTVRFDTDQTAITLPAGVSVGSLLASPQNAGTNDAIDSDGAPTADTTQFTIAVAAHAAGENEHTFDLGLVPGQRLGNVVWNDLDDDGIFESGEPPISGIQVALYLDDGDGVFEPGTGDVLVGTQTTDGSGRYWFSRLANGSYWAAIPGSQAGLAGLRSSTGQSTSTTADNNDNGAPSGTFASVSSLIPMVLTTNQPTGEASPGAAAGADETAANTATGSYPDTNSNLTIDFGFFRPFAIGNQVWSDDNGNGVIDGAEAGIGGVTVNLLNSAGTTVLATTTTDGNGLYVFSGIAAGTYVVEVAASNFAGGGVLVGATSSPGQAGDNGVDNNDNGAHVGGPTTAVRSTQIAIALPEATGETPTSPTPGVPDNQGDLTVDFGFVRPASIGNFVWEDLDADGIQDAGEPGIAGVTVRLLSGTGTELATTTTDANGLYSFTGLAPGTYRVDVITPAGGYIRTLEDQGANDAVDSDIDAAGETENTVLTSGENDPTWDAGFYRPASLGDRVWLDLDADGIQDAGEPGIVGIPVDLLDAGGNVIASTVTGANGIYAFAGLVPGTYSVRVDTTGYQISPADQGGNDATDSDIDGTGETPQVILASNQSNPTLDAGLYQLASIGDFVWLDLDADGIQDAGEPGISGVTVRLLDGAGTELDTTTTDANGAYSFIDLVPGTYRLDFLTPAGLSSTVANVGGNDAVDSDASVTTGETVNTVLVSGENDLTWDAGFFAGASLGDFVWHDLDADGVQDAGEPGIPGVTVRLLDGSGNELGTTTTDSNGLYAFTGLTPGVYRVDFGDVFGFERSPVGTTGDTADSDADLITGETTNTTLVSGEDDPTWDAGYYQLASIGNFVWEDLNGNGVQDAGEPGVEGVTVRLLDGSGAELDTTTTDASGFYGFTDLVPGTYRVDFGDVAGFVRTGQDAGGDDTVDSDADLITGETTNTTLVSGENDPTWDAGYYQLASIGNFVWEDLNGNGVQDAGEPGVEGVTVRLLDGSGAELDTTTTDASGFYGFTDLVPGTYRVDFGDVAGFVRTGQDAGGDDTVDSDADLITGETTNTTLVSGEDDPTWDAGYYQPASIGDFVWLDLNADGIQDAGEPGLEGVTVELRSGDGTTVLDTTTTDSNGAYSFTGLAPGQYSIRFGDVAGHGRSPQDQTGDALDSDADPATGQTVSTTLVSGENDPTWDAGYFEAASIGDFVWHDLDADGVQDAGEPGIAGVTVNLLDGTGTPTGLSTTTDGDGAYAFTGLAPGVYRVELVTPAGFVQSPYQAGGDATADSDAILGTGQTVNTFLSSGEDDPTWDAGYYQLASIGNFVWEDLNGNGVQDAGEPGIEGVTVRLLDGSGAELDTTTTDASGFYGFTDLVPGTYRVDFGDVAGFVRTGQDAGGDDTVDSDADLISGETVNTVLVSGENDPTWDAGYYQLASIGNFVWEDLNGNGVQDAGEPGVEGVTVRLLDGSGAELDTTTTDASGFYGFTDLVPGTYRIDVVPPAGYLVSPQNVGDDTLDSDIDQATGETADITLDSGEDDDTWDGGLYRPASIGDRVWLDLNGNGVQDPAEPGLPGVTVNLYDADGNLVDTATTGAAGDYGFDGLTPGDYTVEFIDPAGRTLTTLDAGGDEATDSDADPADGTTDPVNLESNEAELRVDAGFVSAADLSVTKSVDDALPNVGDTVTFTITVTNDGPDAATNVVVEDALPAGMSYVGDTASQGAYDTGSGLWTVGDLAVDGSATLTIDATVDTQGTRTNIAQVNASDQADPDSVPDNDDPAEDDQDDAQLTTQQIDLSVTKTVDDPTPQLGDTVTFTVTVTNDGPDAATGVALEDLLPAGLSYTGDTASQGSFDDAAGVWSVGGLAVDGSATLTIDATVDSFGPKTNTAQVSAADQVDVDSTPGNDDPAEDDQASATVTPEQIDLSVTKTVDDPTPNVGDSVTFTITVSNAGPDAATGVALEDLLPAGLTYTGDSASQGSYDDASGIWTVGSLAVDASATLTIDATVDTFGTKTNTAQLSAADQADLDSTPGNDDPAEDDQASATLTPQAIDLSVTKTVDDPTPQLGDTVTFTITVSNAGPDAATGVALEDLLPAGLSYTGDTVSQGSFDDATGIWTLGTLAVDSTATLTIDATVDSFGAKTNTAQVSAADQADVDSTPANDDPAEDDQASATVTPQQIDLSVTKTVDNPTPQLADTVTFTVTVTNGGPDAATGVALSDLLPAGLTYTGDTASQGSYDDATGLWTVGTLVVDATATLTIDATVDSFGAKTNTAQVSAADQADVDSTPANDDPAEDDQASATVTPQAIDLSVAKTVDDPTPQLGDAVTFTVTVTNDGPDAATGVALRDVLPAGLTYTGDTASQGSYDDASGIWTVGTLAVDATATLSIDATVDTFGAKTNTAQVSAADQADVDSTPANDDPAEDDQASATVTPQQIDLSVTKTVDDPSPNVGGTVTFTVTVTNAGPDTATGVALEDVLPAGLTYTGDTTSQGTYDAATGVWSVGSVASGGSATLTVDATVSVEGSFTNIAQVSAADQADADSRPANDDPAEDDQAEASVSTQQADLSVTKTVDDAAPNVGDTVTFTITVTNAGPDTATGVVVADVLPAGLTYTGDTASQGSFDDATGLWTVGDLAVDATATLTIDVTVDSVGAKANTAQVVDVDQFDPDSTPDNDDPAEDDQATATLTPQAIDLSVTKTVDDPAPQLGDTVTFTVTVTNGGPDAATGVALADVLPAGLSYTGDTASQGTYDDASGVWSVGSLAVDATATLTIDAAVDSFGAKTNTAQVSAADQADVDSTPANGDPAEDDQASATVTPQQIDLSVTKTVDDPTPNVGDTVTFTITVTNDGPDSASGVVVEDVLPAGMTYSGDTASQGSYDDATGLWTVGDLALDGSATLTIDVTVDTQGTKTNTAQVSAADQADVDSTPGNDDPAEDDQASAQLTTQQVDLSVTKTVDNQTPNVGDTVTFTITVSNAGPNAATNVVVEEVLPAGTTYVADSPSQGAYDSATGLWAVGGLAADGSATLTIDVTIDTQGTKTNIAQVNAVDQADGDSTPDNDDPAEDDQDDAELTPLAADLTIVKTVDDDTLDAGDTATFRLVVGNDGPDTAAAPITVVDTVPAGLTLVSAAGTDWDCTLTAPTATCTYVGAPADLASGDTLPEIVVSATVDADSDGLVTNTATVSSATTADPDLSDNTDTADVTTQPVADLTVDKEHVGDFVVGVDGTWTIQVRNEGPSASVGTVANPITVSDTLPTGLVPLTATGTDWDCAIAAQDVTCDYVGTVLAATDLPVISVTVDVTAAAATHEPTEVVNTATVAAGDTEDPNPANDTDDDPTTVNPSADMRIVKTSGGSFVVGQQGTYTLTVDNLGESPAASDIVVTDTLPAGLTFVGGTSSDGWVCAAIGQDVTCTLAEVFNADRVSSLDITVEVTAAVATVLENTATVASPTFDPDPDNNTSTVEDPTTPTVDLTINKSHAGDLAVGGTGTYLLAVGNEGPSATSGTTTVEDTLPTGLVPTDASGTGWNCAIVSQTVSCESTDVVAAGGSFPVISITVDAQPAAYPAVVNTGTVAADPAVNEDDLDDNTDDDPTTVDPLVDLTIDKAHEGTFVVGAEGTYTLTVTNNGPTEAPGTISVTDQLPVGLGFVSGTGDGWTCSAVGQDVTCTSDDAIGVGASTVITLVVAVGPAAAPGVTNTAEVSSPATETDDTNNDDEDPTEVITQADLAVNKTHDGDFQVGGTGTYTIVVTNNGPSAAGGPLVVTDTLPDGLEFVSASGDGWVCAAVGQVITCTFAGSLADGASSTITVEVEVTTTEGAEVVNTAEVDGPTEDPVPGNNTSDDPTTIDPLVNLTIDKILVGDLVQGEDATWRITVGNDGPSTASGIVVTDVLPEGLSYVGFTGDGWSCTATRQTVTCTYEGTLAAGETASLDIITRVNAADGVSLTNTASVSGNDAEVTMDDNSDDATAVITSSTTAEPTTPASPTPTPGTGGGPLATTGATVLASAMAGLVMMLVGACLVLASRRRRRIVVA